MTMVKYRLFFSSSKQEKKEWTFTWQSQLTTPQNILITMRAREKTKRIAEKKLNIQNKFILTFTQTNRILLAKNQNTKNSDYVFYQKKNKLKIFFLQWKTWWAFYFSSLDVFVAMFFHAKHKQFIFRVYK